MFCDEDNMYFLSSFQEFRYTKNHSKILYARNTQVVYFDKKYGWEKIKDVGLGTAGSIWIKDEKYYYFDDLGDTQLVNDPVFEITDKNVLNELLSVSSKTSTDRIREMVAQKQMKAVSGEVQFKATVK